MKALFRRKSPGRRRVFILPTMFGVTFALALFMMLLMAYTYQNNLAYALTFFLIAFGVATMFATARLLEKLSWEPRRPGVLIEGEPFPVPFLFGDELSPAKAFDCRPLEKTLSADGESWVARRRGIIALKKIEVATTFPAGLFRSWSRLDVGLDLVVAPAPEDFGLKPGAFDGDESGDESARRRAGDPEDLTGLAPARPEEPPTRIDWPALARGRGLLRKEFDEEPSPRLTIRWRDTESLQDPEQRLRQMSAWILAPRLRPLRVQGPSGRWFDRREDALEDLARHPMGNPP